MDYLVESGIEMPRMHPKAERYPFRKMNVGDSFEVAGSPETLPKVRAAASYFRVRNPEFKFSIRCTDPVKNTYRCWRIA